MFRAGLCCVLDCSVFVVWYVVLPVFVLVWLSGFGMLLFACVMFILVLVCVGCLVVVSRVWFLSGFVPALCMVAVVCMCVCLRSAYVYVSVMDPVFCLSVPGF